jgi:hypothetical protein
MLMEYSALYLFPLCFLNLIIKSSPDAGWPYGLSTSAPAGRGLLYTRHHTATLPSHLAKHTMGHNLLLALSYHVRSGLKRIGPTIATAPRSTLHVATI